MISLIFLITLLGAAGAARKSNDSCFPNNARFVIQEWGNSYWLCQNWKTVEVFCPPDYRVDPKTIQCVYTPHPTWRPTWPPSGTTPTNQICIPGTRIAFPYDNTKYQQCDWNGKSWRTLYCQPNSIFNERTGTCDRVYFPTYTTRPPTTTTTPFYGPCIESAGAAGYKPDINSCQNYYQCASGVWVQRPCPAGTVWSQQLLTCDHNRGQCHRGVTVSPSTSTIRPPIHV